MWFKNIQIFRLSSTISYQPEILAEQLQPFSFTPCLPSFAESLGWTSPLELAESPLIYAANGYLMLCMQLEEKVLPATVIRQEVEEKIKQIEIQEARKVKQKEKQALKDETIFSLRPRAFSKYTKIYAYIDTKKQLLILNTCSNTRTEKFTALLKRSLAGMNLITPTVKKPAQEMTYWLQHNKLPGALHIEKSCLLQDPEQQTRIIRCQQQNLFANSIQSLIKDGCLVTQLGLTWDDDLAFVLTEDFQVRNIRYQDELLTAAKESYIETAAQQFDADFTIMIETLDQLITELLSHFEKNGSKERVEVALLN